MKIVGYKHPIFFANAELYSDFVRKRVLSSEEKEHVNGNVMQDNINEIKEMSAKDVELQDNTQYKEDLTPLNQVFFIPSF